MYECERTKRIWWLRNHEWVAGDETERSTSKHSGNKSVWNASSGLRGANRSTHGGMSTYPVAVIGVVVRQRTNALVILLHVFTSRLVYIAVFFRSFTGSQTKCSVVALFQHTEKQEGKDRFGENVQKTIPEELHPGKVR